MSDPSPKKLGTRKYIQFAIFGILFLCVAIYVVIPVFLTYLSLYPARSSMRLDPLSDYDLSYEDVELTTKDGNQLFGWYIPSQNGAAVVVLHGYGGTRQDVLPHAVLLANHGYGVLLFDLHAHGASQGDKFPFGWDADEDIIAALDYLGERADVDSDRIGVMGLSVGAEAAIQAAARDNRVQAVVSEGMSFRNVADLLAVCDPAILTQLPGVWMMVNAAQLMTNVPPPPPTSVLVSRIAPRSLLLIAANVPEEKLPNQAYYEAAGDPKSLWVWEVPTPGENTPTRTPQSGPVMEDLKEQMLEAFEGEAEAQPLTNALTSHPDEYEKRVVEFFDAALLN